MSRNPLAIVGIAGMFPEARDVREFWGNVLTGRDCISEVPESHWRVKDHYDPDMFAEDKTYARRGGFLPATVFDPAEHAIPPAALDSIGLVQLLSLEVAKEVLRDAGCEEAPWYDPSRTGVMLGVCGQNTTMFPLGSRLYDHLLHEVALSIGLSEREALEIQRRFKTAAPAWTADSFPGILPNVVSGRIANRFDLGAANCTVDAACASSLAALRMAASELVEHRADLMITGGCDADNSVSAFMCFSKTPALSPSGLIKPFDASADGTLIGEGIGMLALKRLADAERDGNRVYAVLRGLGGSSDGRTNSMYAPSEQGQLQALRRAYADADLGADCVELIEAHGTGTAVGDSVELTALRTLLGDSARPRSVAIGSVKSQVGHTKAAAGAVGLIKAALALHHKVLPPTINVDTVNDAADGALYVNTRTRPWVLDPHHPVRRGAVSAFGFGGVNFHAVLEEHRTADQEALTLHSTPRARLWHAPDTEALLRLLREGTEPESGGPIPAHHVRLGILAADEAELTALISRSAEAIESAPDRDDWSLPGKAYYRRAAMPAGTKVAALFSGQGSQYENMGLDALVGIPPVRRAFDEANMRWQDEEETLAQAVYPPPGQRAVPATLQRTSYAQCAIVALAMGQFRYLREVGLLPQGLLGHSCGELTALWAAGSLTDEGCLALTRERGRAMEPPVGSGDDPGAMAAARMSLERWQDMASDHPGLTLCNINAVDEIVVGGPTDAVRAFTDFCATVDIAAHRLPVAAAFHTPLIEHAVDGFSRAVERVGVGRPLVPVLANTPDARYGDDLRANNRTLVEQLARPVDFAGRVRELYAEGFRVFVECGPKQVLTRLVQRTLDGADVEVIATDAGPGGDSAASLKCAALRLAVLGMDIRDINRYDAPAPAPRAAAPSPVARLLEGPSFAVTACRDRYNAALKEPFERTPATPAPATPAPAVAAAPSAPAGEEHALVEAATRHLELHTQYVEGQLHTARSLTGLLEGERDENSGRSLLREVEAVRDHGVALSRAHIRAQEVLLDFARLGLGTAQEPPTPPPATGAEEPDNLVPSASEALPVQARGEAEEQTAEVLPQPRSAPAAPELPSPAAPEEPLEQSEVERTLRELVAEKTGYTFEMVDPTLDIQNELGIDSLKQVEIASEAWRRYPSLPRDEIYRFAQARTVRDLSVILIEVATASADVLAAHDPHAGEPAAPLPVGRACWALEPLPEADVLADAYGPHPAALLLDDRSALADALADALSARGWDVRRLALPGTSTPGDGRCELADWTEDTLHEQLTKATASAQQLGLCVLPVARGRSADTDAAIARLSHAVLVAKHVVPALKQTAAGGHRAAFMAVTQLDGSLGLAGSDGLGHEALFGGLGGLIKALSVEEPSLHSRVLDCAPHLHPTDVAARFLTEMTDVTALREIGWDGEVRRTPTLATGPGDLLPLGTASHGVAADDLLVVTGGARGITAWCLETLAAQQPCGLLLLGRTRLEELPEQPEAREPLDAETGDLDQQREMHATIAALRAAGADVTYLAADVGDAEAVRAALAPYAGRVTGVLHGAGVLADQPLAEKKPQDIARVVGTKLAGLANVLAALEPENLRHLVVFTSVAGIYGNGRQTDYAMANEALNRFACAWKKEHPHTRVAAMAWGPWRGGMASKRTQELFTQLGVPLLDREKGCAYFVQQMAPARSDDMVTVIGPLASFFRPAAPPRQMEVVRELAGLAAEPVLRDHSIDGRPVLPMTAAIGWGVNLVERAHAGRPVTRIRDFRVRKGLVLDGSEPPRARVSMRGGDSRTDGVSIAVHDDGPGRRLRYEGAFAMTADGDAPPRMRLPEGLEHLGAEDHSHHPAYTDGFLFHGPLLRGLGRVLSEDDTRLVVTARLQDPSLARGAYSGVLYSPASADLLLQAAALLGRRLSGHRCLPVSVGQVDLYDSLPDDEPFVIVVEFVAQSPLELTCTVSACTSRGDVLQRWEGLKGIVAVPELANRAAWPAPVLAPADL
ncbi:SDR family NAD(P)-dependent oxidoreductase [Streptomyces sp. NPDC023327]|uniref:SDR family NAD(P)-dependent oxidoreductase n=1 Tax=Streptomyces sp. NPDC023327 TaxID=3157088 RepID=UPI0033F8632A